jgi:hypothetical protein
MLKMDYANPVKDFVFNAVVAIHVPNVNQVEHNWMPIINVNVCLNTNLAAMG